MQCCFDGNCLDIFFDTYFAVWYVISDQDRYSSRSPASGVINVIKRLIILDIDVIPWMEECFMEAEHSSVIDICFQSTIIQRD